jgi:hypothetical protein
MTGWYGSDRVIEWHTWRQRPMAIALRTFRDAMTACEQRRRPADDRAPWRLCDPLGQRSGPHWRPALDGRKRAPDSPHKIDAAIAACLSLEARTDSVASGATAPEPVTFEFIRSDALI